MKKILPLVLAISLTFSLSACKEVQNDEIIDVPAPENAQGADGKQGKVSVPGLWSEEDPFVGEETAPIAMVVYSDFQCPFCAEFFVTLKKLEKEWVESGRLRIQYRDFPLTPHFNSVPAHIAANAAAKQGKYMEMHRRLFEQQKEWETANNPQKFFRDYAEELGLDLEQFESDMDNPDLTEEIRQDKEDGRIAGITGTPGFFINGMMYDGALSLESMIKALNQAESTL